MMRFLPNFKLPHFKLPLGIIAILITVIALAVTNYVPGTILTGWDNLHPEFALDVNIKRSLFAVWQEYQGLGLLGGMGHASDLVRQILLIPLSFAPVELVRYFATVITLLLGSVGAYFLIKKTLLPYDNNKELIATIGGLFYLLNLSTIQSYYVAFEAFTSHYASLPWLLYSALLFIKNGSKKNLIIFSLITLLATPAGYIPTLFVVFLLSLSVLLLGITLFTNNRIQTLKNSLKAFGIIFIINAFWLLPFLYFTLTSSAVTIDAKMNQMATEEIFLQNKEYGNILSVIKLQGFWFGNVDPDLSGNFRHMLAPWIEHFKNPIVAIVSYLAFGVIIAGIIGTIKSRRPLHLSFLLLFLFAFTMIATDTPVFSTIVDGFRQLPLFGQAFRFPFTKFSLLTGLAYAIFFAFGISYLINLLKKPFKRTSIFIATLAAIITIGTISYPAFTGNLFYEKEQIKLPDEYKMTFEYFKNQDPNTRIANFPQHTFWGWNFYNWGYGGSGFLWYGIKQPILDRAFDVWSAPLENYYYEVSNALYSQDPEKLEDVLNKYDINYILLDKNVIAPSSPKSLFYSETIALLEKIDSISKDQTFSNILIYKVDLREGHKNFLKSTPILPSANGYKWGDNDIAYQVLGNYKESQNPTLYFPFRSLFSNKLYGKDFEVTETNDFYIFSKTLPNNLGTTLTLPSLENETTIPVKITSNNTQGNTIISAEFIFPKVKIGNTYVKDDNFSYALFIVPDASETYTININGQVKKSFDLDNFEPITASLLLQSDNYITLTNDATGETLIQTIAKSYLSSLPEIDSKQVKIDNSLENRRLEIILPKITEGVYSESYNSNDIKEISDCNVFRDGETAYSTIKTNLTLTSTNDTLCSSTYSERLVHDKGYLINLKASNIEGKTLHFWVANSNNGKVALDLNLKKEGNSHIFFLPPIGQFDKSYSFHMDNSSIGRKTSTNEIKSLEVIEIPYSFITNLNFSNAYTTSTTKTSLISTHPNESLYTVSVDTTQPTTVILSQSYDKGWKAYEFEVKNQKSKVKNFLDKTFPFFFGKEVTTHVKVNNWANGWEIDTSRHKTQNSKLIIVYLPQYLQYLGFLLLGIFLIIIFSPQISYIFQPFGKIDSYFRIRSEFLKEQVHLKLGALTPRTDSR